MSDEYCNENILLVMNKSVACEVCMKNNILLQVFFLLSFIPFTLILSSMIVAKYVFIPYVEKVKNEQDIEWPEEKEKSIPYEEKYKIKDNNMKNDKLNTDKSSVCESTPDGLVFMKYNKNNECYDWWGDNKQIKYKYLETVARKYVSVFQCANLYVNRKDDIKRQLEMEEKEEKDKKEKEEKGGEDSDDDLFVKVKPNEKVKPKKKEKRAAIHGNRYKYNGKIKDFKILHENVVKEISKKIDFSNWKKLLSTK
jgi:hypothetical protein